MTGLPLLDWTPALNSTVERPALTLNVSVEPEDVPRLKGQCGAMLARLRQGPATNDELSRLSRKYTSRVSDLRKNGYRIENTRIKGGLTLYTLRGEP